MALLGGKLETVLAGEKHGQNLPLSQYFVGKIKADCNLGLARILTRRHKGTKK
ncbi:MAG: hypothetical protein HZA01_01245 [Nitrospinae bacterium]|nr:hypothetical protein [Nitrospinota bacterium]